MREVPDDWLKLLASWSDELLSTTGRIQNLIGGHHRPTTGSYREALLRRLLRRVLPDRFRVSTGFIYRWGDAPSRQIDVLIWDAQKHFALLEEGELVILTPESVSAVIEVKSTFKPDELRDALDLLSPAWLVHWSRATSKTGLPQQTPDVPLRAVFAYTAPKPNANAVAKRIFRQLSEYYRERFGDDAEGALHQSGGPGIRWLNLVDAVCVADCVEVEQTSLSIKDAQGRLYDGPGLAAFPAATSSGNLAVGRFCMYLLSHLCQWPGNDAAETTLRSSWTTTKPGACCFGALPRKQSYVTLLGSKMPPDHLWLPKPPLWS